LHGIIYKKIME